VTDSSAALRVASSDASRTEVDFGTSPTALTSKVVDATQASSRTVTLPNLRPGTKYYYRVRVTGPGAAGSDTTGGTLTTEVRDTAAPVISGVQVRTLPDGTAAASWRTQEESDSTLLFGRNPRALTPLFDGTATRSHAVVATGLAPNATYYYRVRSVDAAGNVRLSPAAGQPPAKFVAAGVGVADQTSAQFRTGTEAGTVVSADDAVRMTDGRTGRFESRVLDAQQMVSWKKLTYRADLPAGTSIRISVRTGSTAHPDSTWSAWRTVGSSGAVAGSGRYAQYRVDFVTSVAGRTPVLRAVGITNSGTPRVHDKEG
jgi:hypothetical protein